MPHWDEPDEQDVIAAVTRDLFAAESLVKVLPVGSRDRELVERTIDALIAHLRDLIRTSNERTDGARHE
jgi:hypothetical protein